MIMAIVLLRMTTAILYGLSIVVCKHNNNALMETFFWTAASL